MSRDYSLINVTTRIPLLDLETLDQLSRIIHGESRSTLIRRAIRKLIADERMALEARSPTLPPGPTPPATPSATPPANEPEPPPSSTRSATS